MNNIFISQNINNIKILNRWNKKEIIEQDLVKINNLSKSFDDNFFTENSQNSVIAVDNVSFEIKQNVHGCLCAPEGAVEAVFKMFSITRITTEI